MANQQDVLNFIFAEISAAVESAVGGLQGAGCGDDHDDVVESLLCMEYRIRRAIGQLGDVGTYSDGRAVVTHVELVPGVDLEMIWDPDPAADPPGSVRPVQLSDGPKVSDLDVDYEVMVQPVAQAIRVVTTRTVGGA